jgi:DNA-binding IscR family transcriptional regulator
MEPKEQVLDAMRKAGEPLSAGAIAESTGLDRKVVDKAMAELKNAGQIESPRRCYWQPAS